MGNKILRGSVVETDEGIRVYAGEIGGTHKYYGEIEGNVSVIFTTTKVRKLTEEEILTHFD